MASTFLQAWQLRDRLVLVDGCLRPWLLGIAVNVALNAARTDRRRAMAWQREADLRQGDAAGPEHAVVEAMTAAHDAAIIAAGIERLTDRERSVVELCLLEGLSTEAAARVLAVPEGTVRSRLRRARTRLRALLQSDEISRYGERAAGGGHQQRGRHHVVPVTGGHR